MTIKEWECGKEYGYLVCGILGDLLNIVFTTSCGHAPHSVDYKGSCRLTVLFNSLIQYYSNRKILIVYKG